MRWYILNERERQRSGQFVAVAAAYDDMTATLVRDYLRERGIGAAFPPVSYLYGPLPTRIWVHADDEEVALRLLEELHAEWRGV
ncbi:MAG: putative signal transducing protein [Fimbriimonadales bacterium]